MKKTALITGISGQDGSYMAELLINKGYRVVGTGRKIPLRWNRVLEPLKDRIEFIVLSDFNYQNIREILLNFQPHEVYNFAAYSTGEGMFSDPDGIAKINGEFVLHILDGIKDFSPNSKLIQASSREIYGLTKSGTILTEDNLPNPVSPYGKAKWYADQMIKKYRKEYSLFAASAVLFNHESPLRGESFVTRKIARAAARIKLGLENELLLGSINSQRDWGCAIDSVEALWLMAQKGEPSDYLVATGKLHSVEDFCRLAFSVVNLNYQNFVKVSETLARRIETPPAIGDSGRIRNELGWRPRIEFKELVRMMVEAELDSESRPSE